MHVFTCSFFLFFSSPFLHPHPFLHPSTTCLSFLRTQMSMHLLLHHKNTELLALVPLALSLDTFSLHANCPNQLVNGEIENVDKFAYPELTATLLIGPMRRMLKMSFILDLKWTLEDDEDQWRWWWMTNVASACDLFLHLSSVTLILLDHLLELIFVDIYCLLLSTALLMRPFEVICPLGPFPSLFTVSNCTPLT